MSFLKEINVLNIDHLGIIAGLVDEIGIVEIINQKLGLDSREKISGGKTVFNSINEDKKSEEEVDKELRNKGYKWQEVNENYGGVEQRWLVGA